MSWLLYRGESGALWMCPLNEMPQLGELLAGGSYFAMLAAMRLFGAP
jgi:hypothetical protein